MDGPVNMVDKPFGTRKQLAAAFWGSQNCMWLCVCEFVFSFLVCLTSHIIEVRDSRTGYLIPARDGPGALPDVESSWDAVAAAAAAAVSCQNVTLISFSFRA